MFSIIKNILFKTIYVFIIIYLCVYIPCLFGYRPLVVVSGSMEPILNVGGILYYEKINYSDYKVGDILVYKIPAHIVSHRIVEVKDNGFITRGDTNKSNDGFISNSQVVGRGFNWCIPYIGYYADYIYEHKYLLVITLGLVFIDMILSIRKENVKNE